MTVRFFALFLMLPASIGWAQHPAERRFASLISESQLRGHVRYLAGLGNRWGGTPSGDKAARYVADVMGRYGLEVKTVSDPERLVFVNERWSLRVVQPRGLRRLIRNEWLAGFSPSVKATRAVLVDLNNEEYRDSLAGKIVLTEQFVDSDLYERIVASGAAAIISFFPGNPQSYPDWAMISNLPESSENRIPLYNVSWGNGSRLRKELDAGKTIELSFSARTVIKTGSPKTVSGLLRGSSGRYFIVCAHGDSDAGGPGADDNASGVAGVLELARVIARLRASGEIGQPSVGVKFLVWGSEYYSTEHYVSTHANELEDIAGVLNYDEIGTGTTRNCIYFESNDVDHNKELLTILNSVGEDYYGKAGFWDEATTNPSQGGTDSYVFLPDHLDKLGAPSVLIPSVTVYTAAWNSPRTILQTDGWTSRAWKGHPDSVTIDFSRYYHSSRDVPEVTTEREPHNMVWAVKAVGIALLRLVWAR